jgi:hypothetical protein
MLRVGKSGRSGVVGVSGLWSASLALTMALSACSSVETPHASAPKPHVAKAEKLPPLEGTGAKTPRAESNRRVGDVAVHRYSGSFRTQPVTVTEEVVAREGKVLVVDYTVEQGDSQRVLRVRMDAGTERVLRLSHLTGEKESPGKLSELDDLMAELAFAPDTNDGEVSSKTETCLVGPRELDCELTKYKVFVGEKQATLAVTRSSELAQDVAGEVTAVDGTVLYRAELLDVRKGEGSANASARLEK